MTKLEFIDKINDILIGLNTAESDALGSLYDELMKATGKEIVVEPYGDEFAQIFPDGDYKVYTKQELVFPNEIDWQQVRIDAAIKLTYALSEKMLGAGYSERQIVKKAVKLADALVAELKKGGQDEQG